MKELYVTATVGKSRTRKFDRAFQRALLYSLLFHGLVFGLFRIKFLDVHESEPPLRPINVAIEKEEHETVAISNEEDECPKFIESAITSEKNNYPHPPLTATALSTPEGQTIAESLLNEEYDHCSFPQKPYSEKIYPLTLQCSHSLSKLHLISDGSELFCEKKPYESSSSFKLATQHYPISYTVQINPKTGKVIRWTRKRELLDKPLQALADRIIETIAFEPFERKSQTKEGEFREKRGKISITFHAPYELIQGCIVQ